MDNYNPWVIEFDTVSRNAALKVCRILAQAIDVTRHNSIVIYGNPSAGKSLIVDGILSELSDHHCGLHMGTTGLMESRESEAAGNYLTKIFQHENRKFVASFTRYSLSLGDRVKSDLKMVRRYLRYPLTGGIVFETANGRVMMKNKDNLNKYGVVIKMWGDVGMDPFAPRWDRSWKITVNKHNQTPAMAAAIAQLRAYKDNKSRRQCYKKHVTP